MTVQHKVTELEQVVIRFSGDSGDGMQLVGNIFSNLSATLGNEISTFPDYPAEMRAPQGTLNGVSGFQVQVGKSVLTPGDRADVLVAMNPAALKTNAKSLHPRSIVIIDEDSFTDRDLKKADFLTDNPFEELKITQVQVVSCPITSLVKNSLVDSGFDGKTILRSKNMFALGLVCWLFNRPLDSAIPFLEKKFSKKPAVLAANVKVLNDGFNFGANTHASISTYRIESSNEQEKGIYCDVNGNSATAFGLIAAAERANLPLFLGSYPITPATDVLHELAKHKNLGVKAIQCEDEIAAVCSAIGASFAGHLAATSTSGPGLALKGEAIGLAVMTEIPLVVVDVQRGGPSTGLPTKTEQSDLLQALYGRNGDSPAVVVAAKSPLDCFDMAFNAAKIALEHMTPVILLTDGFIANGSSAWKIPNIDAMPAIKPPFVTEEIKEGWKAYQRNEETLVRSWAKPGIPGFEHRIGGLEKHYTTSAISMDAANHQKMTNTRYNKIAKVALDIPLLEIEGDENAELLVVGWGGTFGHLHSAVNQLLDEGKSVAYTHFQYINPLPSNTAEVLKKYKKILVCELNTGQFAGYLRGVIPGVNILQYNKVEGQPFMLSELVDCFTKTMEA
ncbi:MAG: 2-oxoacid:acceptor oxidoreductase subunit alpha [Bacteroidales bacterium]|nr:2-oxoacid:acceptor oxidoreductase subunit alpha [Bacteroidales bacterium]